MLLNISLRHALLPFISQLLIKQLVFSGAADPSFLCKYNETKINTNMLLMALQHTVILYIL